MLFSFSNRVGWLPRHVVQPFEKPTHIGGLGLLFGFPQFQCIQHDPGQQPIPNLLAGRWLVEQVASDDFVTYCNGSTNCPFGVPQLLPELVQSFPVGLESVGHRTCAGHGPKGFLLAGNFFPYFTLV